MFQDRRSKRLVLVAHCVLNQNAKIDKCAHYPGAMTEVAEELIRSGVGIVQMPCPELLYLGLDRQADPAAHRTVESEDDRVAARMQEPGTKALCAKLAEGLAQQVEEYRKNGFEVLGVIGINGSPTCGVESGWSEGRETPGPGVLIEQLQSALARQGLALNMRGVKAREPKAAIEAVEAVLSQPEDLTS